MNQCDGCRRGLPMHGGVHYSPDSGYELIGCTKDRYRTVHTIRRTQATDRWPAMVVAAVASNAGLRYQVLNNDFGELIVQVTCTPREWRTILAMVGV